MVARESPAWAATAIGADGTVLGVTGDTDRLAGPLPAALEAVTVTVYVVPLVRPVTVQVVAAVAQVWPPG